MSDMDFETLRDALIGIYAYDSGSVGSGIRDESLRLRVRNHLLSLPKAEHYATLSRIVWYDTLSPEAQAAGYAPEDALELLRWLDDQGVLIR